MKLLRRPASPPRTRRRSSQPNYGGQPVALSSAARQAVPLSNSQQVVKRSQKAGSFWLQRLGMIVLLMATVASLVNVLSLSAVAKVLPLSNSASNPFLRSQSTYQAVADQVLASSIWNRNKLTIDAASISRQLMQKFPELSSVNVTLPLLAHRPIVYVQAARPAVILTTNSGAFVLDDRGKALLSSNSAASFSQFDIPTVTDQSGLRAQVNHQTLTVDDVSFIQTVAMQLAARHFGVASMVLPAHARELDVYISNQPYFIKYNLQTADARQQVGTFLATIALLQRQKVTPAQYVDVRLGGRAYYK